MGRGFHVTVQNLGEVLEVSPASVGMEKSHLFRGGSDLNSSLLFIQILAGACALG